MEAREVKCPTCDGSGVEDEGTCGYRGRCRQCGGKRFVPAPDQQDTPDQKDK